MVCLYPGLDFHEDLHRIGAKEGLKGRKLQKAMESYAWNITVLKVRNTEKTTVWPSATKALYYTIYTSSAGSYVWLMSTCEIIFQRDKKSQILSLRLNDMLF